MNNRWARWPGSVEKWVTVMARMAPSVEAAKRVTHPSRNFLNTMQIIRGRREKGQHTGFDFRLKKHLGKINLPALEVFI